MHFLIRRFSHLLICDLLTKQSRNKGVCFHFDLFYLCFSILSLNLFTKFTQTFSQEALLDIFIMVFPWNFCTNKNLPFPTSPINFSFLNTNWNFFESKKNEVSLVDQWHMFNHLPVRFSTEKSAENWNEFRKSGESKTHCFLFIQDSFHSSFFRVSQERMEKCIAKNMHSIK